MYIIFMQLKVIQCNGNNLNALFIVWQRFCEPDQTKNCILSACPSVCCPHPPAYWKIVMTDLFKSVHWLLLVFDVPLFRTSSQLSTVHCFGFLSFLD